MCLVVTWSAVPPRSQSCSYSAVTLLDVFFEFVPCFSLCHAWYTQSTREIMSQWIWKLLFDIVHTPPLVSTSLHCAKVAVTSDKWPLCSLEVQSALLRFTLLHFQSELELRCHHSPVKCPEELCISWVEIKLLSTVVISALLAVTLLLTAPPVAFTSVGRKRCVCSAEVCAGVGPPLPQLWV